MSASTVWRKQGRNLRAPYILAYQRGGIFAGCRDLKGQSQWQGQNHPFSQSDSGTTEPNLDREQAHSRGKLIYDLANSIRYSQSQN